MRKQIIIFIVLFSLILVIPGANGKEYNIQPGDKIIAFSGHLSAGQELEIFWSIDREELSEHNGELMFYLEGDGDLYQAYEIDQFEARPTIKIPYSGEWKVIFMNIDFQYSIVMDIEVKEKGENSGWCGLLLILPIGSCVFLYSVIRRRKKI